MTPHHFHNVRLVLQDEVVDGSLSVQDGQIAGIDRGSSQPTDASLWHDCDGDYLLPGLVELHTDNMEKHFMPRPRTFWPNGLAAVMAHDADVASSGITTVFDSICVGVYDGSGSPRKKLLTSMVQAIGEARESDLFRSDHKLHFRCELSDPELETVIDPVVSTPDVLLVSLMDHTPGQRQWADLDRLRTFSTKSGKTGAEIETAIQRRIDIGSTYVPTNRTMVLELVGPMGVALASHDDTTEDHVLEAKAHGIGISEFPCSMIAAQKAHEHGLKTIGGAPNVVRGESHSGNVAMIDLANENLLDGLSSDYVPASLLQAAFLLANLEEGVDAIADLPRAIRMVTTEPADMVGLSDRGRLQVGCRADFIRVQVVHNTPIVKEVYVKGQRVA